MSALEKKIASALASDTMAVAIAALVAETQAAITQADTDAEVERAKALDPALSPDAAKARAAMEDAAFMRDRLRTVLPRLQQRHQEVAAQEYLARWQGDYESLTVKRDQLATELREVYPDIASKVADLLTRIAANDAELSRLHQARPAGVALHLLGAELMARDLESFNIASPSIAKELKLPDWSCSAKLVWPPPSPPLSSLVAPPVAAHLGADWWRGREQRAATQHSESDRVAAYYEDQQRARESTP
jgi:hypothetical protein